MELKDAVGKRAIEPVSYTSLLALD